jgi:translation initiation factor 3 subunit J
LFGGIGISNDRSAKPIVAAHPDNPADAIDLSRLPLFNPGSKDSFTKLRETLVPLLTHASKKPQYHLFLQEFTKQICKEMSSDQIKKVASGLTALSNEKMKEEKAADKGGSKKKTKAKSTLVASRDVGMKADTTSYDANATYDDL